MSGAKRDLLHDLRAAFENEAVACAAAFSDSSVLLYSPLQRESRNFTDGLSETLVEFVLGDVAQSLQIWSSLFVVEFRTDAYVRRVPLWSSIVN